MKPLSLTTFICLLAVFPLQAAELSTTGQITRVTVYPGSAKILRLASVDLPAGSSSILITGLPLNLQESSLRVSGKSASAVVLSSVSLQRDIHTDVVQEQEKQLRQQIEQQQLLQQEVRDNKQRQVQLKQFIISMGTGGQGDKPSSYLQLPPEQWQQAWTLMQESIDQAQRKMREADQQTKAISKKIQQLQAQLKQVATHQRSTRSARLEVKAAEATRFAVELSYQVHGAGWTPVYDAYLDTETSQLQIRTLAQIRQRTGEDWMNVQATLSTLRPSANTRLPSLDTWVIDFYTPPAPVIAYDEGIRYKRKAASAGIAAAPPMRELAMEDEVTLLATTDYTAEYQLPTPISLQSGSDKRRFLLSSDAYPADIELASVPRLDPRVMLTGKAIYKTAAPLLAGSVSLYRDGDYVGNSQLAETQTGEEIRLSFGEDDRVKINFHPDPDKKRKSGLLFGKRKVVERNYLVSIQNNHQQKKSIILYDILPIAADEKIKIETSGDKPDKMDIEEKKGVVSWNRTLPPGKKVELRYGYSVSYPEDKELDGL